jgi:hypothetical protein
MSDEDLPPSTLVAQYLARRDWWRTKTGAEPPKTEALSIWEGWIERDPERAWPVFVEFVRVRPEDDDVLDLVWYRMRLLLSRHGRTFQKRVLELVASNALLTRIGPPNDLTLTPHRRKTLDLGEVALAYMANAAASDVHELGRLMPEDPLTAAELVLEIIERGPAHGFTCYDTYAPLATLLARNGSEVVDVIEAAAEKSLLVWRCLWWMSRDRSTSLDAGRISADVFDRLEAVRAEGIHDNTDDPPGSPKTLPPEYERVVEAWFAYERTFWAFERVNDLVSNDPDPAWRLIERLVAQAPDDDVLGAIAAGPLEDFISDHGIHFIDRIERWAARDERFRQCLAGVWQSQTPDEIWARIEAARNGTESDDTH